MQNNSRFYVLRFFLNISLYYLHMTNIINFTKNNFFSLFSIIYYILYIIYFNLLFIFRIFHNNNFLGEFNKKLILNYY